MTWKSPAKSAAEWPRRSSLSDAHRQAEASEEELGQWPGHSTSATAEGSYPFGGKGSPPGHCADGAPPDHAIAGARGQRGHRVFLLLSVLVAMERKSRGRWGEASRRGAASPATGVAPAGGGLPCSEPSRHGRGVETEKLS
jgi:hypothetical protein